MESKKDTPEDILLRCNYIMNGVGIESLNHTRDEGGLHNPHPRTGRVVNRCVRIEVGRAVICAKAGSEKEN